MLGLRNNILDSGASPAEYLYGTTLRISGEFVLPEDFSVDRQIFIEEFREHMRLVKPVPVKHKHKKKTFFYKDLQNCSHVFVKDGTLKKTLKCPYLGPHKIIKRISDRVFEVEINGNGKQISIENFKPAFFVLNDNLHLNDDRSNVQSNVTQTINTPINNEQPKKIILNKNKPKNNKQ